MELQNIAILAGNYRQYKDFLNQKEISEPCNYIYIDRVEKTVGYRFFDLKVIGTFWDRSDSHELYDAVKFHITGLKS